MLRKTLLLAALAGSAGCGRKLPPESPLSVIPARVQPVKLTQEGSDVVLRFPRPTKTSVGEALTNLTRVTVYRDLLPAPPGAHPPAPPTDGAQRQREERTFRQRAQKVRELTRADLDQVTVGSEVVVRDSLYPLYLEKRLGKVFLRYGVIATRDRKRESELSPLTAILPRVPPDSPLGLRATVEEKRVCLDWLRPPRMLDGTEPVVVGAYAVYRREEKDDAYEAPIGVAERWETYVDDTAASGKRYVYTVRAAPGRETPLILGPPSDELLVDTADVFAPPPPEGLLVLSEAGRNRLVWNPVLALDLLGYSVYRKDPGKTEFRKLAEKLKDPSYVDTGAPAGAVYAVTATDRSGNQSRVLDGREERR